MLTHLLTSNESCEVGVALEGEEQDARLSFCFIHPLTFWIAVVKSSPSPIYSLKIEGKKLYNQFWEYFKIV